MKQSKIPCKDIAAEYDLQAKYQHYNALLWNNELPDIRVVWGTLKRVGGYAHAKTTVDPSKPKPNPVRVRLGLDDKYANHCITPGSIYIKISALYQRSELAIDKILLHEMIHVHLMVTGHLGEGHGPRFSAELRRVQKLVGFDVPVTDNLTNLEFSTDIKIKPYGVILLHQNDGFRYNVYSANLVTSQLHSIRKRYEAYALLQKRHNTGQEHHNYAYATVYLIADKMWSEKAMRMTVQRKLSYGSYRMTDQTLLEDLRLNGKILAEI